MTLTPQDADSIIKECPSVRSVAPIVRARTQLVFGNRNYVPTYLYGTTPSFLDIREWTDLDNGEAFTEHDVLNVNKVCMIGQTIVRQLFGGESPIGKEIRIRNVAFKVVGVLRAKGANMMGMDQDDVLLAPWTTIKYRVVASSLSAANQSTTNTANNNEANSLSQTYPESPAEPLPGSLCHRADRHTAAYPVYQRGPDTDCRPVCHPDSFCYTGDDCTASRASPPSALGSG